ncbi:DNA repair exonuclease [Thiorhodococcus mannitoliphagus]|uniref:DNA repair exonuclease n=1 Tax=Thiorhodococcus mannitoliphagus TaxID=329406 RepID=A0A6P1DP96_9GAMM|nr:DNA repair exonuclease [Thiorhodococcus mannitoliphagus]NEX19380.1 DNA repair exonuclease [Thiorhodococcus mannitoliphagus]
MFRFIHAADLHLDSPLQGLQAHDGAPLDVLRGATRRAFENLVQLAIDERVDFVVIAGDLYDGDWKDYSTGLFFRSQMAQLNASGIPVYLIAGNHDAASVITKKLGLPDNVRVFSTRTTESFEVPGLPVIIHGRGFPNRAVPENLALDYPSAIAGKFNLGLLHTSLTGRPGHATYAPCSEQDLRSKGYGYWALGHVHQPEVISKDPWIVFAGNCQGRHARETGPRGCCLVSVNDALEVEGVERRTLDVVRWQDVPVVLDQVEKEIEATQRIRTALADAVKMAEDRLLAARITLTGASPLHGCLHREAQRWRAEILGIAQDFGEDAVWIEQIKVATSPVYDLGQLAERDALTKIVLETLEQATHSPDDLPDDILEMLNVLPLDVRAEVEREWATEQRSALMADVRAIILDSLQTEGGTSA